MGASIGVRGRSGFFWEQENVWEALIAINSLGKSR